MEPTGPVPHMESSALRGDSEQVTFTSEGLELHGRLWQGPRPGQAAVLFCHGTFDTQESWADYASRLSAAGFSAFTFDFAGHGESQGVRGSVSLRTWAYNLRDAMTCLGERGYSTFGLVGWESGGAAAVLAAAHDKRLACAVLLSTPVFLLPTLAERVVYLLASGFARVRRLVLRKPVTVSRLKEMQERGVLSDEAANEAYFADPRVRQMYEAFPIPEGLDAAWLDITTAAEKVRIPVLVIHGAHDRVIPITQGETLHSLLPGRRELKIMRSSGHALHLDRQRDEVYELILAWLKANLKGS